MKRESTKIKVMKKVKFEVLFENTGCKFTTSNKLCLNNPTQWIKKKLNEPHKNYKSLPSKFIRPNTLKEAFAREYQSSWNACKCDHEKAIKLSISNIKVYSK
tara:strand:- start:848 stop:1153 length:306 start_codon:yes stop_codon:yes gene_type:complete